MYPMVFNPRANRENVRDFNERLAETCGENPIVDIRADCLGAALILTLVTADDVDAEEGRPTLTATMRPLDSTGDKGAALEEELDLLIEREAKLHSEDDPHLPFHMLIPHRTDDPTKGYVVVVSINGNVEDNPEDEKGDPEDDDPDVKPGEVISGGFPGN